MPCDDTIVALATPAGEAALAVLRVSGSQAPALVKEVFTQFSRFAQDDPQPRIATLGHYRDRCGTLLDQVIYIFYAEGASYTGESLLEISCHGNPFIVQKIIEDLLQRGCRVAEPGEFTRRAFINGGMDLTQAEAVIDLIRARGDRALEAAHKQLSGHLGKKINQLIDNLLQNIAALEAYIDFPEEDLPPEEAKGPMQDLRGLRREMEQMISTSPYHALLQEGIKAVIAGPPNAGKSSLLNALVGDDRVIVSEEPGTTRDFIEALILMGPYPVRMIDTAGFHDTHSKIEQQGIRKTLEQVASADITLLVLDSTAPAPSLPANVMAKLTPGRALVIENKIDLPESRFHSSLLSEIPHSRVSVRSGQGIEALKQQIGLILEEGLSLPTEDKIIVSARHATALREAKGCLDAALAKMGAGDAAELIASDLRSALESLGEIVGKIDQEKMLDKLFRSFCIGK